MQFRPIALLSAIALAGVGLPASVHALSMDAIQTSSTLGQPYTGRLLLRGAQDLDPRSSCIRVSESENGLPGLGTTRVSVKAGSDGWIVQLRSEQRIDEPAVQFLVTFNCYGQRFQREYSVLLDLPSEVIPAAQDAAAASSTTDSGTAGSTAAATGADSSTVTATAPAVSRKKKSSSTKRKRGSTSSSYGSRYRAPAAATGSGRQRDAVKLAVLPGSGPASQREAELMAQAEDQAAQLRQMEMRIVELQAMIEKMRVYIPQQDLARLHLQPSPISPASAAVASAVPASAAAAGSAVTASALAASATGPASAAAASPAASSAAVASAAPASAVAESANPFDWMFWVWMSAAVLAIAAFLAYVVRQKRIERHQAWGGEVTEEMLDSYAPARRAEVVAKLHGASADDFADDTPIPAAPVAAAPSAAIPGPVEPAPVREAAVEFVDVQHSASAVEEAEWLISHGEGERAIALLREEIRNNPDQVELWLMLFQYLYDQKKNLEFVTLAHRFRRQATGSEAWKQVCDLGLKLDPENRLFLTRNQ